MRKTSLARRSSLILCAPLLPVLALGLLISLRIRHTLDDAVARLEAAQKVKELSRHSLTLLLTQEAVTKSMLLDPEDMSGAARKLEAYDENAKAFAEMRALSESAELLGLIAQLEQLESQEMQPADTAVLEALGESGEDAARKAYASSYEPVRARYEQLVRKLGEVADGDAARASDEMAAAHRAAFRTTGLLLVVVIVLVVLAGLYLARQISRRALHTAKLIETVAAGDLTRELEVGRADELGDMAIALNRMISSLRQALGSFGVQAQQLSATSTKLSSVSGEMAASARDTALQAALASGAAGAVSTNVRDAATGVGEISSTIADIARSASEAAGIASSAVGLSQRAGESIAKLAQSSQEIGEFVAVINSIADQTNLLALNATIEAARAGEAGKGFAVVAGEVKELAHSTAQATRDIAQRVEGIRADTRAATEVIGSVVEVIGQIDAIQCTIAAAVEEQAVTARNVTESVDGAATSSAEIAGSLDALAQAGEMTNRCAAAIEGEASGLSAVAAELRGLVERFTIDEGSRGVAASPRVPSEPERVAAEVASLVPTPALGGVA